MQWGLKSARGQAHTLESIGPAIERIRTRFPVQGSHDMKKTLLQEEKIMVPRQLILEYMNTHHRQEVIARRSRRLKRSYYWTAGVNNLWSFDQHNKWQRFQLFLHVGLEPFSGQVLWLKVWWTNRNPRLICGWYCDTVPKLGGMPLVTQSDPGSENNGIANGHTLLRHLQDPSLERTLQHKFKGSHRNIKPEIFWNQLRRRWSPGFERLLDYGLNEGLYNPDNPLQRFNHTLPRHNRNKILPHERPADIFEQPENFESQDFSVKVHLPSLDKVRNTYAPPDHPVFELVPPAFAQQASAFISSIGSPIVTQDNAWDVYLNLLAHLTEIQNNELQQAVMDQPALPDEGFVGSEFMPLMDLPVYKPLPTYTRGSSSANEFSSDDDESDYMHEWTDSDSNGSGQADVDNGAQA
ncbi:hypothetical protein SERLADRAFT_405248 [Serpula lacrymans var. lacrymans S7.9]|uniref:Integrase core domain-containing protein n=1 Tax=Serpula lacrymans var. lacrymans (strain S7.9) TaxID=578457 RepID=F8NHH2_SERL9|nr:uncharacterized protein SERLADRAFT_405248 [Serpula lacrymans var. lacrymans S7.9]EGO29143.1 hypothetical protein SERLADRAFT_405248 [Serpula lacrymans var. lacrymans S7.9]